MFIGFHVLPTLQYVSLMWQDKDGDKVVSGHAKKVMEATSLGQAWRDLT